MKIISSPFWCKPNTSTVFKIFEYYLSGNRIADIWMIVERSVKVECGIYGVAQ